MLQSVSDSLVRLFGSLGFESGSERSRFPWLASIAVFFGLVSGLSLACLWLVSGLSLVCLWLVWSVCTINSEYPLLPGLLVLSACTITSAYPLLPSPFVWFVCTIGFRRVNSRL